MSVYFAERDGLIKIGVSRSPATRCQALRARLLGEVEGDYKTERQFHRRFAHLRVHGEWFAPDLDLIGFIDNLPPFDFQLDGILQAGDVARYFAVTPSTVISWANRGLLAHFRLPSGAVRFHASSVEAFIAEQESVA